MAVDIDAFKKDLEQLKNQRSVIQAKLDEATRHLSEQMETLKGMGYDSVDEAKQAYAKQLADAEGQHALVKQLMYEISQVDVNVPTREDVMARLNSMESVPVKPVQVQDPVPVQQVQPVPQPASDVIQQSIVPPGVGAQGVVSGDFIQQSVVPPATVPVVASGQSVDANLSGMLFASL